jgi:hypothetical protein
MTMSFAGCTSDDPPHGRLRARNARICTRKTTPVSSWRPFVANGERLELVAALGIVVGPHCMLSWRNL